MADLPDVSAHTDPELLGLLAVGEEVGTYEERAHLETCEICAHELAELHRLAVLGRSVSPETALATPSHEVWSRIRAELGFDPHLEPPTRRSLFLPSDDLVPPPPPRSAPVPITAPVTPTPARTGLLQRLAALFRAPEGAQEVVARAELSAAGPADARGSGWLEVDEHGARTLRVTLATELPATGLRYVWLLDHTDPTRMQPIGQLGTLSGFWSVGPAVDVSTYDLLDVSQQAPGSVVHSGESIVRGRLVNA